MADPKPANCRAYDFRSTALERSYWALEEPLTAFVATSWVPGSVGKLRGASLDPCEATDASNGTRREPGRRAFLSRLDFLSGCFWA